MVRRHAYGGYHGLRLTEDIVRKVIFVSDKDLSQADLITRAVIIATIIIPSHHAFNGGWNA